MAAAPAKIKAFLASVKDSVLDNQDSDFKACYFTLLQLELLQRGVIVEAKDPSKLLDAVVSTAGKALLDEASSPLPKPLLAGSAVMAGRMAEQAFSVVGSSKDTDRDIFDNEDVRLALKRCRDVQDERLRALLNISADSKDISLSSLQSRLLYIAESYFYRAASFQPDAPPMWKRAWDVILERQRISQEDVKSNCLDSHWEAVFALTNLHRIVSEKGNTKRAAELSLRLAESCLLDDAQSPSQPDEEGTTTLIKTFIEPYRAIQPSKVSESAKRAAKFLNDPSVTDEILSEDDLFLRKMLELRIPLAEEQALLQKDTETEYSQAKNRFKEGSVKKEISLESVRVNVRQRHLTESVPGSLLDSSAVVLRDALLSATDSTAADYRHRSAYTLLRIYLMRQRDRARAICIRSKSKGSDTKAWSDIADFIIPVFTSIQEGSDWNSSADQEARSANIHLLLDRLSAEALCFVESATLLVPCIEWMNLAVNFSRVLMPENQLRFSQDLLSILYKRAKDQLNDREKSSSVVKSMVDSGEIEVLTLECAYESTRIMVYLGTEEMVDDKGVLRHSTDMSIHLADKGERYGDLPCEYGTSFLTFLVSWSGLQQTTWQFCVMSEARRVVSKARMSIEEAAKNWGRYKSPVEAVLMDLAQADAEVISSGGGLVHEAWKRYINALDMLEDLVGSGRVKNQLGQILRSHCYSGLAKLLLSHQKDHTLILSTQELVTAEDFARRGLDVLAGLESSEGMYLWRFEEATSQAARFQRAGARQLIATSLLQDDRTSEAFEFVEAAVQDAPLDATASFALAAFRLRTVFLGDERSPDSMKTAQVQLLKAAKLDATKAAPFALLGYWYENANDVKRAVGCYSKALLLDSYNPIAGRGLLRLKTYSEMKNALDNALAGSSPFNGWAWRAVGIHKAMFEADDDLAVVSFVRALRCRDIEHPRTDPLSIFYSNPADPKQPEKEEMADVLARLAGCYRRLGRFTAAIRSFHSAIDALAEKVSSSVLCACAQVEMELGLFDEAAEKFTMAMGKVGPKRQTVAGYGLGVSLLSMAKRDIQDGKAGSAFAHLQRAIKECVDLAESACCAQKVLGDLYTLAAALPPTVFGSSGETVHESDEDLMKAQVSFVTQGAESYRAAEKAALAPNEDESNLLRACFRTDLGSNILLQAQLLSFWHGKGTGKMDILEVEQVFDRAGDEFRRAIKLSPLFAPAWCGLGCAVVTSDPLLAQHAFSRSLELENLFPDAYANLSFLYTSRDVFGPSTSISDALTQVADTPVMWINRALILERSASNKVSKEDGQAEDDIRQAADAYRAALQVGKHPSAMFGLSLTCRIDEKERGHVEDARMESSAYLSEYLATSFGADISASVIGGVLAVEEGAMSRRQGLQNGLEGVEADLKHVEKLYAEMSTEDSRALDVELIRKTLSPEKGTGFIHDEGSTVLPFGKLSVDRKIVQEPNRGDLWVLIAKELAQSVDSESSEEALDLTRSAARRATNILMDQRSAPSTRSGRANLVRASDLSDALALLFWLNGIDRENGADAIEQGEDDTSLRASLSDLQQALLINPCNLYAREALKSIS